MTDYVTVGGLKVAQPLYDLVHDTIAPGTGIESALVWRTLEDGRPIYGRRLLPETVRRRIETARRVQQDRFHSSGFLCKRFQALALLHTIKTRHRASTIQQAAGGFAGLCADA